MKFVSIAMLCVTVLWNGMNPADFDFKKAWKNVEKAMEQGLPKSALKQVETIYAMAVKEHNDTQIVKATLYKTKLVLQTKELGLERVVSDLDDAIAQANSPSKQLLQSYAAELLQSYFQNQYYRISKRTNLDDKTSEDIRTWSPNQYRDYIHKMYISSLNETKNEEVTTESIKHLLSNDSKDYTLRPRLQDLLIDRALEYYSNSWTSGMENTFDFSINDTKYLGTGASFEKLTFEDANQSSKKYQVLKLYQDALIRNRQHTTAYINYDLARLNYILRDNSIQNADEVYLNTLNETIKSHKNEANTIDYRLAKAEYLFSTLAYVEAMKEYTSIQKDNLTDRQKNIVQTKIVQITQPILNIQTEQVYTKSEQPTVHVNYRNLNKAYFRLIAVTDDLSEELKSYNRKLGRTLSKQPYLKTWSADLTNQNDYKQTSQNIQLEKLPFGKYILVASNKSDFDYKNDAFEYAVFHVSDIGYSVIQQHDNLLVTVVDRNTGKPIHNATIEVKKNKYYGNKQKTTKKKIRTNTQGKATISGNNDENINLVVSKGNDVLDLNANHHFSRAYKQKVEKRTEIFTDRAIYRPGQTVHFKVLALELSTEQIPSILTNESMTVTIYDANYQEVSKVQLVTNTFGSASGTFILPKGTLTGQFSISTDGGSKGISVEEYKRPTFEVNLDELTSSVALGDEVTLQGNATSYAGAAVSNAIVRYTVTRRKYDTWWRYCWGGASESTQVKTGETTADAKGKFDFNFTAIGKQNDDANSFYNFEINVDVIHSSGETRSTSKIIKISTKPYGYAFDITSNILDKKALEHFTIKAFNAEGKPVKAKSKLIIRSLELPKQWKRNTYWTNTNNYLQYKKPESTNNSSLDAYPVGKVVSTQSITIDGKLDIDLSKTLLGGAYEIEVISEKDDVSSKQRIATIDYSKGIFPTSELLYTDALNKSVNVGDTLNVQFGTSDEALTMYYYLYRKNEVLAQGVYDLEKHKTLSYTPTNDDRGGLTLFIYYTKHNRFFSKTYFIDVPWSQKELNVQLQTKRDKTKPGSEEEWTVSIDNKESTELMATMYDVSLDVFRPHNFTFKLYPSFRNYIQCSGLGFTIGQNASLNYKWNKIRYENHDVIIPSLRGVDYNGFRRHMYRDEVMMSKSMEGRKAAYSYENAELEIAYDATPPVAGHIEAEEAVNEQSDNSTAPKKELSPRTNLNETVFFYPHLTSDDEGNITFKFKMNDVLTKWKLLAFAHDKDLRYGFLEHEIVTQKELMIVPNAPRFVREGDRLIFPATVTNFTDTTMTIDASLSLNNSITDASLNEQFDLSNATKKVTIEAGESMRVEWEIVVPSDYKGLLGYTVTATSKLHRDAETGTLPVLTNQKLITETKIVSLKEGEAKTIDVDFANSTTSIPHQLTVEYTSNPIWYAIQALPYISKNNGTSTVDKFVQYYTNALATNVVATTPKIKAIFDTWKEKNSNTLKSNLEKNEALKYALLEETPWVRDGQSETAQKQNIALLFEVNKLAEEKQQVLSSLIKSQNTDGGFSWMHGSTSSVHTTLEVLVGIAQLERLQVIELDKNLQQLVDKGFAYLDRKMLQRYDEKIRSLDNQSLNYLYLRSFYTDKSFVSGSKKVYSHYLNEAEKEWQSLSISQQVLVGIIMHRVGDVNSQNAIVKSLVEKSFYSDDLGRYWNLGSAFNWQQTPISVQARMIELFTEVSYTDSFIDDMKIWLIKQKQTNRWANSKATIDAIYALLIRNERTITPWLTETKLGSVRIGNIPLSSDAEAGTGYVKQKFSPTEFDKNDSVNFKNNNSNVSWGAVYYQYFEDLDKIKSFRNTPLKLQKKLYKLVQSDRGEKLVALNEGDQLTIGDKVMSRIELKVDRDMSYVHLKDMRASGFEPENTLSGYKYKDGISYYESMRDVASHFFIYHLRKGTYIFEYPLQVVHKGTFSEGIATIQCMYAPEYTSHSKGTKVVIE